VKQNKGAAGVDGLSVDHYMDSKHYRFARYGDDFVISVKSSWELNNSPCVYDSQNVAAQSITN